MELNLDLEEAPTNYWEVESSAKPKDKKKITFGYDDILSSINLVVKDGVLQRMLPTEKFQQEQLGVTDAGAYNANVHYPAVKKVGVDPQVKNSAIFNKYFKNYKDPNEAQEQVKIPKTREELRQMLIEQHVRQVQAQTRIAQIKPKKMFFGANGTPTTIYASQPSMHSLFKFR
jgi:hypothetical protein